MVVEFNLLTEICGDKLGNDTSTTFTPQNIADDMIGLIKNDFWTPDVRILDINVKSGSLLKSCYNKLFNSSYLAYLSDNDRRKHILDDQLFGITGNAESALIASRYVYGTIRPNLCNIKYINNYNSLVVNADRRFILNEIRKDFSDMQFDVIMSNPPYNKGMDLDFVNLGFDFAKQYAVFITPAKWQTAEGDQKVVSKTLNYSQFRKKIVPHMKEVVYYPDCIDIFDIRIYGGISYFLLDKNTCEDKVIKNVNASHQEFNSVESRKLDASGILNNLGTEINELLSSYKKVKTFNTNGRYQVWITDTYDSSSNGSCMFRSDGKTGVLCPTRIIDSKNSKNTVGTAKLLFASDIKAECESFVSWLWCKFIRFMILIAVDGFHMGANMHYYRFVPAPPIQQTDLTANPWDHIYTDKELYDYFKLPQKYIDVIESVIKERKKLE